MQTTIPFIDAQPVTIKEGSWLSGIGLHHRGHAGYGGYVGLTVATYNFSSHLMPKPSEPATMMMQLRYDFNPKK